MSGRFPVSEAVPRQDQQAGLSQFFIVETQFDHLGYHSKWHAARLLVGEWPPAKLLAVAHDGYGFFGGRYEPAPLGYRYFVLHTD